MKHDIRQPKDINYWYWTKYIRENMSNKEDSVDFKKLKHRFNPPKRRKSLHNANSKININQA